MAQTTHPWSGQLSRTLPIAVNARWAERLLLSIALAVIDPIMVILGFWLAYTLRFQVGISWFYQHQVEPLEFYLRLFILVPAWLIIVL